MFCSLTSLVSPTLEQLGRAARSLNEQLDLVAARSLILLTASRLALRAPRAARGYGLDAVKRISAVATVRSARGADRGDSRPKPRRREPLR
jgi:hypothetical protein